MIDPGGELERYIEEAFHAHLCEQMKSLWFVVDNNTPVRQLDTVGDSNDLRQLLAVSFDQEGWDW